MKPCPQCSTPHNSVAKISGSFVLPGTLRHAPSGMTFGMWALRLEAAAALVEAQTTLDCVP
jgi:hypothetical protein